MGGAQRRVDQQDARPAGGPPRHRGRAGAAQEQSSARQATATEGRSPGASSKRTSFRSCWRQSASPRTWTSSCSRPRAAVRGTRKAFASASWRRSWAERRIRAKQGIAPVPKVTLHALRCTYISLMLEAGAPLPYVMDQVGHADSKTTLEVYAQVHKRVSRHREDLAAARGPGGPAPCGLRRTSERRQQTATR